MRPVLEQLIAADPQPPVQVTRDGSRAEEWVCRKLQQGVPPDWRVLENMVVADQELKGNAVRGKGIKGEADALLLDAQGVCQSIIEIKVGEARLCWVGAGWRSGWPGACVMWRVLARACWFGSSNQQANKMSIHPNKQTNKQTNKTIIIITITITITKPAKPACVAHPKTLKP